MKQLTTVLLLAAFMAGCGNNAENHSNHDTSVTQQSTGTETENIQRIKPAFTNLDAAVSSHVKNIFDHYIHVKTALVNSNMAEAKNGAAAILEVLSSFDKSLLPADQKGAYDKNAAGMKASANNIASANDLEKQREHFATLSGQAYDLAKTFGAGKIIYHDHCPMAFNDKGAMWLSETKEIKNPYFGDKMMKCGTVEEVIEK